MRNRSSTCRRNRSLTSSMSACPEVTITGRCWRAVCSRKRLISDMPLSSGMRRSVMTRATSGWRVSCCRASLTEVAV
ncbi:hypothetical protein D3C85_1659850 [compost metagenome]